MSKYAIIATTAACCCVVLPGVVKIIRTFRALRSLPGPASRQLIAGNMEAVMDKGHHLLAQWTEEYGGIFSTRFLWMPVVVVTDPAVYAKLLRSGPDMVPKDHNVMQHFEKLSHPQLTNILTSPTSTPYWKAVRRAAATAFTMASLRALFPAIQAFCSRAVGHLQALPAGQAVDVMELAQRLTMDVIGASAYDTDLGCTAGPVGQEGEGAAAGSGGLYLLHAMQQALEGLQASINDPLMQLLPFLERARTFRHWVGKFGSQVALQLGGAMERRGSLPPHSLAAHLLECLDPATGKHLTLDQLKAEFVIFNFAGYETTAVAMAWAMMLLATHPEAERRLVQELQEHGLAASPSCPQPRALQWEDLAKLKYLAAVVNEALRLFPPAATGGARTTTHATQVGPHTIPAGVMVIVPFYAVHRSSANWADPNVFQPDRWLAHGSAAGAAAGDILSGTGARPGFAPFSEGPRNCVGQALALLELKAFLATAYGRLDFRLREDMGGAEGRAAAGRMLITLKPEGGMWMTCSARA